jgi:hypothetical protein
MSEEEVKELKEAREEIRRLVDENFKPHMAYGDYLVKWTEKTLGIANELERVFKQRAIDNTSVSDLRLITTLIAWLTEQLSDLAKFQYRTIGELKEAVFQIMYVPLYTTWKFSEKTFPLLGERLKTFENEIQRLKKSRRKIELKIPKKYEGALEELTRRIVENERAQKKYVE